MFSRLKKLFVAGLLFSSRSASATPTTTLSGAFDHAPTDQHQALTRHYLDPQLDFTPCEQKDEPKTIFIRSDQIAGLDLIIHAIQRGENSFELLHNNSLYFSLCDENNENVLHTLIRHGSKQDFINGLTLTPTSLMRQYNAKGQTLVDVIQDVGKPEMLFPLLLSTEPNLEFLSAAWHTDWLQDQRKKEGHSRHTNTLTLQNLAMLKHHHPTSEAGRAILHYLYQKHTQNGKNLTLLIDFDLLSLDFPAALQKIEHYKTTVKDSKMLDKLHGQQLLAERMQDNRQPYQTIQALSLLQTLRAVQSLPDVMPLLSKSMKSVRETEKTQLGMITENCLWRIGHYNYTLASATFNKLTEAVLLAVKNIDSLNASETTHLHHIADDAIAKYKHSVDHNFIIARALTIKVVLYRVDPTRSHQALLLTLLQLQMCLPGYPYPYGGELIFKQIYQDELNLLTPAEKILTLRILMAQSFFDAWDKREEVLAKYLESIRAYQTPLDDGFIFDDYTLLDETLISVRYQKQHEEIIIHEKFGLTKNLAFAGITLNREAIAVAGKIADPITLLSGSVVVFLLLMKAKRALASKMSNVEDNTLNTALLTLLTLWFHMVIKEDCLEKIKASVQENTDHLDSNTEQKLSLTEDMLKDRLSIKSKNHLFIPKRFPKRFGLPIDKPRIAATINAEISRLIQLYHDLTHHTPHQKILKAIEDWRDETTKRLNVFWENEIKNSDAYQKIEENLQAQKEQQRVERERKATEDATQTKLQQEKMAQREAALTLSETQRRLNQLHDNAIIVSLEIDWDTVPNFKYSTVETKVAQHALEPAIKKYLTKLKSKFDEFEKYQLTQQKLETAHRQHVEEAGNAVRCNDLARVQKATRLLEKSEEAIADWLRVRDNKIEGIHTLRSELQTVFKKLNAKFQVQTPVANKPKINPDVVQKHAEFVALRAEKKRLKKALQPTFPVIDITQDAIGVPLIKAGDALAQLAHMPVATESLSACGLLSMNVFVYTQLFDALAKLAQSPIGENLPADELLSRFRNQFTHAFQTIDPTFVQWLNLANDTIAAFQPVILHYTGNQALRAAPAPAQLPALFKEVFTEELNFTNQNTTTAAITQEYSQLAQWLRQAKIADVNTPHCLAMRGIILQLAELTHNINLIPYRNQDAHNDLQTDISVQALLNLAKVVRAIKPTLFGAPYTATLFPPNDAEFDSEPAPQKPIRRRACPPKST